MEERRSLRPKGRLDEGLEEHLRKQLPDYMIPKEMLAVSRFPLNSNGKIDRKALLQQHMQAVTKI